MKTRQKLVYIIIQFIIIFLFLSCANTGQRYITENNHLNYSELVGEKITVQLHKVFGHWHHVSLKIIFDTDALIEKYSHYDRVIHTDENGLMYITIGAGPNGRILDRKLIAAFNRPRDIDEQKYTKVETHDFYLTIEKLEEMIDIFNAYDNNINYALFPNMNNNKFNSNSFITGLLYSIGLEPPNFNERYRVPGYYKPIPMFYN